MPAARDELAVPWKCNSVVWLNEHARQQQRCRITTNLEMIPAGTHFEQVDVCAADIGHATFSNLTCTPAAAVVLFVTCKFKCHIATSCRRPAEKVQTGCC
jgi:hypothetical protein